MLHLGYTCLCGVYTKSGGHRVVYCRLYSGAVYGRVCVSVLSLGVIAGECGGAIESACVSSGYDCVSVRARGSEARGSAKYGSNMCACV